jgi:competence protein ComEA
MLRTLTILTALFIAPLWAQDDLPDGPGKAVVARVCAGCHGSEMFSGYYKAKAEWDDTISQMTDKGLSLSDADYNTILGYLSTCLGTTPTKIEINKAPACQLTKGLGIPQKQADAIVAWREKNGDFKDLAGVKKVEGVDAAAIDKKSASITF